MKALFSGSGHRLSALVAVVVFLSGCATAKIDWSKRIGTYTYDQTVLELGPPDKQAKLSDGHIVAEWISRYYNGGGAVVSGGYYGNPGIVSVSPPSYYESKLLLTFTTNNVLSAWSKK